jgi:SnoaL-like domain
VRSVSDEEVAEAVRQIRHITASYFDALDRGHFEQLGEVFRYARTRSTNRGRENDGEPVVAIGDDPYEGDQRAVEMFRQSTRFFDGIPCTKHFTTNLVVDVDREGRSATSRSRFSVVQSRPGFPLQPIVTGRYFDSFELRDGRWWLVDRFEDYFLWGDVREHLHDSVLERLHLPSPGMDS